MVQRAVKVVADLSYKEFVAPIYQRACRLKAQSPILAKEACND